MSAIEHGELHQLAGWESHVVSFTAELVNGKPRVTSLSITLKDEHAADCEEPAITQQRIRNLPLNELASRLFVTTDEQAEAALALVARKTEPRHDPRAVTTVEAVAALWNDAHDNLGKPPRAHVCAVLGIGARTADSYIAKARAAGLITATKKEKKSNG